MKKESNSVNAPPAAPLALVIIFFNVALTVACFLVDTSGSPSLISAWYTRKAVNPPTWFTGIRIKIYVH